MPCAFDLFEKKKSKRYKESSDEVVESVESGIPMERVATDILGEFPKTERGNRYILVVSDYFTKWKVSFAMPNMEAQTVANI